jgi:hypothetical protein
VNVIGKADKQVMLSIISASFWHGQVLARRARAARAASGRCLPTVVAPIGSKHGQRSLRDKLPFGVSFLKKYL